MDNFLHFTFPDHLSISKIKIPKLPLKSGTPLRPLRFGRFCRFFQGFSHILKNPLESAKNWKLHQISYTISHIFCIIDHFSISRFRCPKVPSKSATLRPFAHCGQSTLYSTDFRHLLCRKINISDIFVHHSPCQSNMGCLWPLSTQNQSLISP